MERTVLKAGSTLRKNRKREKRREISKRKEKGGIIYENETRIEMMG